MRWAGWVGRRAAHARIGQQAFSENGDFFSHSTGVAATGAGLGAKARDGSGPLKDRPFYITI